ncbi:MAG: site-specific integrase [Acidobacteria bacterium]|nr:site-specific integrase [Acidobacteriota bacterium]
MAGFAASIRVRSRADGTHAFDVRYRLEGRSRTMSFTEARAAERWAAIVRRIGAPSALELLRDRDSAAGTTVDEWAERYLRTLSGVEGATVDHYRSYLAVSISPTLGALPLDSLGRAHIAEWINDQAERYAAKTVKNRHGFLSAMLQGAVNEGLLDRNPCTGSRLPESEQREMVFLSPDEYRTLLSFVPEYYAPLVQLLAATGMRFGEVTALRPADFDWHAGTVRIARAWKRSQAKGWYVGAPKTRRSRRTISLPTSLLPQLREQTRRGEEWAFVNQRGGPIRQPTFWDSPWHPARRLANGLPAFTGKPLAGRDWDREPAETPIGKWPRIHDLRHSHVSWLISDGISLPVIQRRLGHESIQTTVDRYGHLSPDMLTQPAEAMDRLLLAPRVQVATI